MKCIIGECRYLYPSPHTSHLFNSRLFIKGFFKDSINLFATTNTFCYGINKQDIQYNYKTNRNY